MATLLWMCSALATAVLTGMATAARGPPPNSLNYTALSCMRSQGRNDCCSPTEQIGFTFSYFCRAKTDYTVSDSVYLSFGPTCDMADYPSIMAFATNLTIENRGLIEQYDYIVDGVQAHVVEWADVAFHGEHDHIGTVQVWLLKNNSIGLVYHLTRADMDTGADAFIGLHNSSTTNQIISHGDPALLRAFDAYLFSPSGCSAYTTVPWVLAPDVCFANDWINPYGRLPAHEHAPHAAFAPLTNCNNSFFSLTQHDVDGNNASKKHFAIIGGVFFFVITLLFVIVLFGAVRH